MNTEGLTRQQQRDLDEILRGLQQSVNLVAYKNTLGKELDFFERFRFVVNHAAQARAE
jgi:hypothetical protein